jgi:chorismate mutase/prephenate dehydratase
VAAVADLDRDAVHPLRVAYQGVDNSYSQLAARKHLAGRADVEFTGHRSFRAALEALESGNADLLVLPIENTTAGSINEVYRLLREHDVFVVGEETWKVDHCLAAVRDIPLPALRQVLSHPQALEQCAEFLQSLPAAVATSFFDTAAAMQAVVRAADPTWAAIGSPEAARAEGLVILKRDIADVEENYTRFVVLARHPAKVAAGVPCKTSLVLHTRHEQGALTRCLDVLSATGHSMTKLESRPIPGRPWEYMFFLDFEGNPAEERTSTALAQLTEAAMAVRLLGSYPAKVLREPSGADTLEAVVRVDQLGQA